ncbi:hypothetical protein, partial [uncultured Senegalimassilia sp.]|uniref:hypothetical protein n=1 Tax=uncultured Senegalimassilia sp. TaxID=1714350 RepID=UPI0025DB66B1
GKSNMLWALDEVFNLLTYPKANANMKIPRCIPFILSKDEPTEMFDPGANRPKPRQPDRQLSIEGKRRGLRNAKILSCAAA